MKVKAGTRLKSTVCTTEVVVVRAPADDVDLRCGGQPMVPIGEDLALRPPSLPRTGGTQLGKRYASDVIGLELLCTKGGDGSLSLAGEPIALKVTKPLPSSD